MQRRPRVLRVALLISRVDKISATQSHRPKTVGSHLKLRLILRIITYLTYICWEINNFVIKSDIFRRFFIYKNILKKLSCYHDNYFRTSCSENTMGLSARRGFLHACMHVFSSYNTSTESTETAKVPWMNFGRIIITRFLCWHRRIRTSHNIVL